MTDSVQSFNKRGVKKKHCVSHRHFTPVVTQFFDRLLLEFQCMKWHNKSELKQFLHFSLH